MKCVSQILSRAIGAFGRDRRGNVAAVFPMGAPPLIAFVGASNDYSRANSMRTRLQDALDSTALMLSKEASVDTSTQLQANAVSYFNALFHDSTAQNIQITASYTMTGGSKVVVGGTASVPTNFMKVLGYQYITVGGSSTTTWGSNRLRVALVLDNTGSMAD